MKTRTKINCLKYHSAYYAANAFVGMLDV